MPSPAPGRIPDNAIPRAGDHRAKHTSRAPVAGRLEFEQADGADARAFAEADDPAFSGDPFVLPPPTLTISTGCGANPCRRDVFCDMPRPSGADTCFAAVYAPLPGNLMTSSRTRKARPSNVTKPPQGYRLQTDRSQGAVETQRWISWKCCGGNRQH